MLTTIFFQDSEDEQMEEEIDHNLDMLHGAAKRLNHVAGAMGREVDIQNKHLDRIGGQVSLSDTKPTICSFNCLLHSLG
jgi:hypothetical protein